VIDPALLLHVVHPMKQGEQYIEQIITTYSPPAAIPDPERVPMLLSNSLP
jgi:hypothetical protein